MNDFLPDKLRETGWRRPLTPAEAEALRTWLSRHPETGADWEMEVGLSRAMQLLPEAPVPSNFTARVLAEATKAPAASSRPNPIGRAWWRYLVPRMAAVILVLTSGFVVYHQHQAARREQIARDLATLSAMEGVSDPKVLQDFEAIRRLGQVPPADEELIALLK